MKPKQHPYILLLRGINVGGKHRLPMAALRDIVTQGGGHEVHTYIQSGNAVFHCEQPLSPEAESTFANHIAQRIQEITALHLRSTCCRQHGGKAFWSKAPLTCRKVKQYMCTFCPQRHQLQISKN